jgi:hypothetical protein
MGLWRDRWPELSVLLFLMVLIGVLVLMAFLTR